MSPEAAKRRIWWVRVYLAGAVIFYFGITLFEAFNLHYIITNNYVALWRRIIKKTLLAAEYFSVSIGLVISAIYLLINMHMYFEKQLQDESRRIKVIFLVLTVSYVSRGVLYIMTNTTEVIEHETIVYLAMYTFWDIIPLSLIMLYHYVAFEAEAKAETEETERSTESTDFNRQSATTVS